MKNKLLHLLIHKSHFRMNFEEHFEGSTIWKAESAATPYSSSVNDLLLPFTTQ